MKVIVNENQGEPEGIKFPVLMKDAFSEMIVLFTGLTTGFAVANGGATNFIELKEYTRADDKETWQPFTGTILLQND